jgi:hypothetical protein
MLGSFTLQRFSADLVGLDGTAPFIGLSAAELVSKASTITISNPYPSNETYVCHLRMMEFLGPNLKKGLEGLDLQKQNL